MLDISEQICRYETSLATYVKICGLYLIFHVWLQAAMMLALRDIVFKAGLLNRKIKANELSKQLLQGKSHYKETKCFF